MQHEFRLAEGQEVALPVGVGTELFCATGAVKVACTGSASGLPVRALQAGQATRCGEGGMLTVLALQASRCRLLAQPAAVALPSGSPKANGLRFWNRRPSLGRG